MTVMQNEAAKFILVLPEDKLKSVVDYMRFLYERDAPLDDYDYELAKLADQDGSADAISFDALLKEVGLTHEDL